MWERVRKKQRQNQKLVDNIIGEREREKVSQGRSKGERETKSGREREGEIQML